MQIDELKLLGLPVLQAQLAVHSKLCDSVLTLERSTKLAARLAVSVITDQDEELGKAFSFPTPEQIPAEFLKFLHDYGSRLVGERYTIEAAIQELKEESLRKPKVNFYYTPICDN